VIGLTQIEKATANAIKREKWIRLDYLVQTSDKLVCSLFLIGEKFCRDFVLVYVARGGRRKESRPEEPRTEKKQFFFYM
jgi:hypothetical protein